MVYPIKSLTADCHSVSCFLPSNTPPLTNKLAPHPLFLPNLKSVQGFLVGKRETREARHLTVMSVTVPHHNCSRCHVTTTRVSPVNQCSSLITRYGGAVRWIERHLYLHTLGLYEIKRETGSIVDITYMTNLNMIFREVISTKSL